MARIRTIKPEFFTSEDIVRLSPWARLLYIALWCEADREGRMLWRPRTFKMRYFPADAVDIDSMCAELTAAGLIVCYGDGLACIPSFAKHQHINPREAQSTLPEFDASARVTDASPPVTDATVTHREEGKGREGKGKELPSTTDASSVEQAPDLIWSDGLTWMQAKGVSESKARSAIGLAIKETDRLTVAELLATAQREDVAEPVSWLMAAVRKRKARPTQAEPPKPAPIPRSHRPLTI